MSLKLAIDIADDNEFIGDAFSKKLESICIDWITAIHDDAAGNQQAAVRARDKQHALLRSDVRLPGYCDGERFMIFKNIIDQLAQRES